MVVTNLRGIGSGLAAILVTTVILVSCKHPDQDIVLRDVRDVVADASSDPVLKAQAVFYNPNDVGGKLKDIEVDILINGRKAGRVDKGYSIKIPAKGEFTVPLEVKLNMKELGTLNTLFGMLGGKKFKVQYVGKLRLSYRGLPVRVPVDHKDDIRISF